MQLPLFLEHKQEGLYKIQYKHIAPLCVCVSVSRDGLVTIS